jgi:hypothetical protein
MHLASRKDGATYFVDSADSVGIVWYCIGTCVGVVSRKCRDGTAKLSNLLGSDDDSRINGDVTTAATKQAEEKEKI